MNTKIIWETYANDVERFIFSKTKSKDISDDLLQEVFLKVHTKISTLKNTKKLKPWLFVIANNTVLDYFKTNQRNQNFEQISIHDLEDANTNLEEHSEQDCLYGIIKNLHKKYRTPLFLFDIKGMKQTDISKGLKLPLSTVKSQIQRARKMITRGFMDCCGFELNERGYLVGEIRPKEECVVCN